MGWHLGKWGIYHDAVYLDSNGQFTGYGPYEGDYSCLFEPESIRDDAIEVIIELECRGKIDGAFISHRGCELYKDREIVASCYGQPLPLAICTAIKELYETKTS